MAFTPMDNGYKMVSERHAQFVIDHPNGMVRTELVSHSVVALEDGSQVGYVVMKCEVWKDRADADAGKRPDGVGHAGMPIPGVTNFTRNSEVENAETSALGRALGNIGYHAKESMATEDEIAMKKETPRPKAAPAPVEDRSKVSPADRAKLLNWGKRVFGDKDRFLTWLDSEFAIKSGKDITPEQLPEIQRLLAITEATKGEGE